MKIGSQCVPKMYYKTSKLPTGRLIVYLVDRTYNFALADAHHPFHAHLYQGPFLLDCRLCHPDRLSWEASCDPLYLVEALDVGHPGFSSLLGPFQVGVGVVGSPSH